MIIITGGAGFIGSALTAYWNEKGYNDIIIIDNLESAAKWKNLIKRQFLQIVPIEEGLEFVKNFENPSRIEAIFHMGACSSTTEKDMDFLLFNNVEYSKSLFNFCTKHNIAFFYASSAATYGLGEKGYDDSVSEITSLKPINPYGFSKKIFDDWVLKQEKTPLVWAGLKFFNVYGPNEYHKEEMKSLVPKALVQIQNDGKLKLFKSYKKGVAHGEQRRDFVYIKDIISAMYHMFCFAKDGKWQKKQSDIYNMGTGKAQSFKKLGEAVFKALKVPSSFEWVEMPEAIKDQYQYYTEAKMDKFYNNFGYKEKFLPLEEGVLDYVNSHLLQKDPYY